MGQGDAYGGRDEGRKVYWHARGNASQGRMPADEGCADYHVLDGGDTYHQIHFVR